MCIQHFLARLILSKINSMTLELIFRRACLLKFMYYSLNSRTLESYYAGDETSNEVIKLKGPEVAF